VDFKRVHDYVHSVINAIAPNDSVERFEGLGVKVILEEGKFLDSTTLATENYLIKAKRFVIATGSIPFIPQIAGLSSIQYYTNESIFNLKVLPEHLVIIGGGPIGIEMAQAFKRFGSRVSVLEAFSALPKDDPHMTAKLKELLINEGIDIKEHVEISLIKQTDGGIEFQYLDTTKNMVTLIASHVLVATGRIANIQALGLEAARINASSKGITVDAHLRTSNPRVYAIGDCIGSYQFTHAANYHAGLAIRNSIFRLGTKMETKVIPWVTYTDPELAHVGFLESQLQSQKISYRALSMTFAENDRAHTERQIEGEVKVLLSPKGHVLGATILGIKAGELIFPWVMAIQNKLKVSAIANSIAPYPTLNDINKRIAGSYYKDMIFSPLMKRIVKFIMCLTR